MGDVVVQWVGHLDLQSRGCGFNSPVGAQLFLTTLGKLLVHGQVTIIFVVSVCLFVCLFVCTEFFSAVFDQIAIKLGHMLYVWV